VILLTDSNSRVPVTVQPSGQKALLSGDNSALPPLEFLEDADLVRPGDRVVTSGDGAMLPAGLLVGQVVMGTDRRLRVVLSADYERLEFLRVLRSHELTPITDAGALIAPPPTPAEPDAETGEGSAVTPDPSAAGGTGDVTEGSPETGAPDG
jgi:rod shape-determining protein MreC